MQGVAKQRAEGRSMMYIDLNELSCISEALAVHKARLYLFRWWL